ncbi:Uncharacterised protein [Serratia quinivorans]|nr:Uncharacterised protein [Serratia quinivorans]CAI1769774.1 Uncharacterised protein [Serratia quinivorans]
MLDILLAFNEFLRHYSWTLFPLFGLVIGYLSAK